MRRGIVQKCTRPPWAGHLVHPYISQPRAPESPESHVKYVWRKVELQRGAEQRLGFGGRGIRNRDIDTTDGVGMWMGTENKMPDYVNVGVERNRMGDDA